ncbi:hypothetical protein RFI_20857 [Reticulomyxa filosa]|uniref:Uncharacterized protein n=1 Tax=Reticulomyxa filosa TaxID=46433 RepID=X6MRQ1_RETFI|nr:hypothetical protein RFI_20857 [Reticulomyxa filosa]|eukprot:ETO16479.1 hypothetical protein RFI_20857 [Reticulomyxa filosa]
MQWKSKQMEEEMQIKLEEMNASIAVKHEEFSKLTNECAQQQSQLKALQDSVAPQMALLKELELKLQCKVCIDIDIDIDIDKKKKKINYKQQKELKNESEKLDAMREELRTLEHARLGKYKEVKHIEEEMLCKCSELEKTNGQFEESIKHLKESKTSLQQVQQDLDIRNEELKSILDRVNAAKNELQTCVNSNANNKTSNSQARSEEATPNQQKKWLSRSTSLPSPEMQKTFDTPPPPEPRINDGLSNDSTNFPLQLSLEEFQQIGKNWTMNDTSGLANMESASPEKVLQSVEKLRRILDAMCYPQGGCVFSLQASIRHCKSIQQSLEHRNVQLISLLKHSSHITGNENISELSATSGEKNNNNNNNNNNITEQSRAVNDLAPTYESLQVIKKQLNRLHTERQHLEKSLQYALSLVSSNDDKEEASASTVASSNASVKSGKELRDMKGELHELKQQLLQLRHLCDDQKHKLKICLSRNRNCKRNSLHRHKVK